MLADVNKVAASIIALRGAYPRANISAIISRTPKMLLQEPGRLQEDADKVRGAPARRPACPASLLS
jgi:hypothetical protein